MNQSNQIHSENSILILIDLQGRLLPAIDQGETVLKRCIRATQRIGLGLRVFICYSAASLKGFL